MKAVHHIPEGRAPGPGKRATLPGGIKVVAWQGPPTGRDRQPYLWLLSRDARPLNSNRCDLSLERRRLFDIDGSFKLGIRVNEDVDKTIGRRAVSYSPSQKSKGERASAESCFDP
ncbi:hypothetical protein VTI74DRAFT_1564 [Chaetomium olivicolor]